MGDLKVSSDFRGLLPWKPGEDLKRPCFTIFKFQRPELIVRSVTRACHLTFAIDAMMRPALIAHRSKIRTSVIGDMDRESFRVITSYARDGLLFAAAFSPAQVLVVGTTDTSPHH